ncbi:MAG TPA: hypothetical protein VNU66_08645 [Mycobacteriales bacterium]|nr:hypothetical protein [Mycobacteriales bacterium]
MTGPDFVKKVYVPVGMLTVLVMVVLSFVVDEPVSGDVVGAVLGGVLYGLPLLWLLTRRSTRSGQ